MHIHILGIGGTFMSAIAILARALGHQVTGCDTNCYPPISDLLVEKGIDWVEGYEDTTLALQADCVIVGNAVKRGMPVIERVMNEGHKYTSGPQWLAEHVLQSRKVLAVAGTHGKTTTTSILAWILEYAGLNPGFLIGGVAPNFKTNARLGEAPWFVIEADEYDSAFFDKRPKLMHYRPQIAVINNLEFDHADIYDDLGAIQKQFHFYLKTIPQKGVVLKPRDDKALNEVFAKGQFSLVEDMALSGASHWRAELMDEVGQQFELYYQAKKVAEIDWQLMGQFNVENAMAAIAASFHAGVVPEVAAKALNTFKPPKRRLEVKGVYHDVTLYDDFAHHPTAIQKTINTVKQSQRHQRVLVVLEFASNTMRSGVHAHEMSQALEQADEVFLLNPSGFNLHELSKSWTCTPHIQPDTDTLVESIGNTVRPKDGILVMSNKGFDGIHQKLATMLQNKLQIQQLS